MPDTKQMTITITDDKAIRCPRCHSDAGLHFDEVSLIDPAGDVVPLHAEGDQDLSVVTATIGDGTQPGRRHLIVLPHWCASCGQRGQIVLRQHSGQTFGEYRELPGS